MWVYYTLVVLFVGWVAWTAYCASSERSKKLVDESATHQQGTEKYQVLQNERQAPGSATREDPWTLGAAQGVPLTVAEAILALMARQHLGVSRIYNITESENYNIIGSELEQDIPAGSRWWSGHQPMPGQSTNLNELSARTDSSVKDRLRGKTRQRTEPLVIENRITAKVVH